MNNSNGTVPDPEMTAEQVELVALIELKSKAVFGHLEGLKMTEALSVIKTVEGMLQAHMREIYSKEVIRSGD